LPFIVEANTKYKKMLSTIRNSKIGIILAIVFGISLFLMKGGNRYSGIFGVGANDVALVGDVNITNVQYMRIIDLNKKRFNEMTNLELNSENFKLLGLDQQSLSLLIQEAILKNEFNNLSMYLNDEIIAKKIKDFVPYLYNENNQIIEENLNSFLINQNLDLKTFIDMISTQLLRSHYENNLFNNISYPDSILEKINKYNNHLREIKYTKIPIESLDIKIEMNDDLIKKYYDENNRSYVEQQKRSIEYILINANIFLDQYLINKQEVENYYNNNIEQFKEKEKRTLIQLNFQKELEADDFLTKISNINDYNIIKNLALENNIRHTEYEFIEKEELLNEIAETSFKIKKNQISDVISGPLAYHIIFVKNITESYNYTMEESEDKIIKILKNLKANNFIQELLEKIDEDIINNYNLTEIATKYSLEKKDLFQVNQNNNFNNLEKTIINSAFNEQKDFVSNIYNFEEENSFYILNVTDIVDSHIKDFKLVKSEVTKDWKNQEIKKLSINKIENEIKEYSSKETVIEKITNKYDVVFEKIELSSKENSIPNLFINKIFQSNINDFSYYINENTIYLGVINKIKIDNDNQKIEEIKVKINNSISNELKQNVIENLSNEIEIKINQDLIDTLTSNI
tara:strand:+ start:738 stop:2627 length:1890 start_codon:yes stop_codon:yes gene_type:complete